MTLAYASAAPTHRLQGLHVSTLDFQDTVNLVGDQLRAGSLFSVVTPNTDHFLRWHHSPEFRSLYEGAHLATVDGAILVALGKVAGVELHRVTGIDLFTAMAEVAANENIPLILIGGSEDTSKRAVANLQAKHPTLQIPIAISPAARDLEDAAWREQLLHQLAVYPRKLVALCLGSPKQERLLKTLSEMDPQLSGVFLCVGAAIDFTAGTVSRAPLWMQKNGLEWLFRLLSEPSRLWRRYLVDDPPILTHFAWAALRRTLSRPKATVATPELTVLQVGLMGEQPGGMAQVVNEYLTWQDGSIKQVGLVSTRFKHDRLAPLLTLKAALKLRKYSRSGKDVVASFHLSERGSFVREGALMIWAHLLGIHTVAHLHGADFDEFQAAHPTLTANVLKAADVVAVLTDSAAISARRLAPKGVQVVKVVNPVPANLRAERGKSKQIVFGGELSERKGVDTLLAAWTQVAERYPEWRLTLAGPIASDFKVPENLPANTKLLGRLSHEHLVALLAASEVAVLPSRHEALPVFLLEAMAARCAVVSSTAGQIPDLLAGGAGLMIEPGNVAELASHLQTLLGDESLRRQLAHEGHGRYAASYSSEKARVQLEGIWRSL